MAAEDSGKTQWHELYHEVVQTNLCTGCAACVMACPRDVLEYDHSQTYHPFNVELSTAADDCSHGQRGCDICTRACPRFRDWEVESDQALFGRPRETEEVCGIERVIGLLCSKSFEYEGMRQIITEEYGIPLEDVAKVNIKGKFQVWRRSTGEEIDIPLKKMQDVTRQGCKLCPDFAAEHADIATGGLGQ